MQLQENICYVGGTLKERRFGVFVIEYIIHEDMKKEIFERSLFLHRIVAKMGGYDVGLIPVNGVSTSRMNLDTVDTESKMNLYKYRWDYSRFRAFELCEKEIRKKYSMEQLEKLCVAEAGVADGNFSEIINEHFKECDCYLYDTFQGFSKEDMEIESQKGFSNDNFINVNYQ